MFEISLGEKNEIILAGRFDASQIEKASQVFESVQGHTIVDFEELDYISSAGLGVLLATQKRLSESGDGLKLVRVNSHIRNILRYAGFDQIFEIE